MQKTSIRFFEDVPVRAVWDDESARWWFCAVDIAKALTGSANPRSYWNALKRRKSELSTICRQLKLRAADGKSYMTDAVDEAGLNTVIAVIPGKKGEIFARWLRNLETSLDEKSRQKAHELFDTGFIGQIEVGTVKGLQQIHGYIFGGLYDFAGSIRTMNIAKGSFAFAPAMFLRDSLAAIEKMPESTFDEIIAKYAEMNIAHPFMEGNGRSIRIWLDMMLKKNLSLCIDWSLIDKKEYLETMRVSVVNSEPLRRLLKPALTSNTNDRVLVMKGIDYSYYYEEPDSE